MKKLSVFLSVVLTCLLLMLAVPAFAADAAKDASEGAPETAVAPEAKAGRFSLNRELELPAADADLEVVPMATDEEIVAAAADASENADTLYLRVLGTLYVGYGNDANGYKGELTDDQFFAVTQAAIWKQVDLAFAPEMDAENAAEAMTEAGICGIEWTDAMVEALENVLALGDVVIPADAIIELTYGGAEGETQFANTVAYGIKPQVMPAMLAAPAPSEDTAEAPAPKISLPQTMTAAPTPDTVEDVKVTISRVNIDGENRETLAGVKVEIRTKDANGNESVVESWTSEATPKEITLKPGTYTYVETEVPNPTVYSKITGSGIIIQEDGKIITDTNFTEVNDNDIAFITKDVVKKDEGSGTTTTVTDPEQDNATDQQTQNQSTTRPTVTNTTTRVTTTPTVTNTTTTTKVNKHNVAASRLDKDGNLAAGAEVQIKNSSGAVVASWTTQAAEYEIELEPGTYTFHEVKAPEGMDSVKDLIFTVSTSGQVTTQRPATTTTVTVNGTTSASQASKAALVVVAKPNSGTPKTGDPAAILGIAMAVAASGTALVASRAISVRGKKD